MSKTFKVLVTNSFLNEYKKLSFDEKRKIEKIIEQLKMNPFSGKPLGYKFFREKKIEGKRLYYLIFEDKIKILILNYSGKKKQKTIINEVKNTLKSYRNNLDVHSEW